ncbi:MAG: nicotinate (nicotinamide) nucleotide adenylyltransferase [Magnetococcales bacterium]|nr:nicotinate (nicotinamide) nucleotide adenylyltransferase [Magnetococcales bacterium]
MSRLLGILGGAFNPPHHGHLRAALEAREALGLEKVLLVPSGHHPFKGNDLLADSGHRLAMTALACRDVPELEACDIEVVRPTTAYTIDTLRDLSTRHPDHEPVFLMGSDLVEELHLWKSWRRLLEVAHLCLMSRPGTTADIDDGSPTWEWLHRHERTGVNTLSRDSQGHFGYLPLPITRLAISSSDIRNRVRLGKSIRFLTSERVIDYIDQHGLYRGHLEHQDQPEGSPSGSEHGQ